ncbi:hypothetical protein SK128_023842 [Halocaridina rubra]|uniref:Uncharacterized protein n=1 Tax=Halocaridina rubra TaxID=373956 RepID=A0AAN9AA70_HALRR
MENYPENYFSYSFADSNHSNGKQNQMKKKKRDAMPRANMNSDYPQGDVMFGMAGTHYHGTSPSAQNSYPQDVANLMNSVCASGTNLPIASGSSEESTLFDINTASVTWPDGDWDDGIPNPIFGTQPDYVRTQNSHGRNFKKSKANVPPRNDFPSAPVGYYEPYQLSDIFNPATSPSCYSDADQSLPSKPRQHRR